MQGQHVLELGVGRGLLGVITAMWGTSVVVVDRDEKLLLLTHKNMAQNPQWGVGASVWQVWT